MGAFPELISKENKPAWAVVLTDDAGARSQINVIGPQASRT
jgi:hypothetical protein